MHLSDCDRGLVLEIDHLLDSLYGEEIEVYIKENNFEKNYLEMAILEVKNLLNT